MWPNWRLWGKAKPVAVVSDKVVAAAENSGIGKVAQDEAVVAAWAAGHAEGLAAGRAEGLAEGEKKGHADALSRAVAILTLPEAKDRMAQAILMLDMHITPEGAAQILAAIPRAPSPSPVPSLEQRGAVPLH